MKIKKGDMVLIITGKDKGKTGKVETVLPNSSRVAVVGINKYRKHIKPSTKNPKGGIIELFRSMHVSNIMLIDPTNQKPTRVGYSGTSKNKVRISKTTQANLDKK